MDRPLLLQGVSRALVLAPGIAPLGALFGAAAANAGLSPAVAVALSALVFAGGAQFAAVALVAQGAAVAAAVGLVLIINSRYLLLSAAVLELARRAGAKRAERVLLALGVVDETYALQAAWAQESRTPARAATPDATPPSQEEVATAPGPRGLLAVSATLWSIWVASTLLGALAGARLPDVTRFGLDYALPGIFVGLLGIFADTRERLVAGLAALGVAGALALAGLGTLAVLLVPPLFAFALGRWRPAASA